MRASCLLAVLMCAFGVCLSHPRTRKGPGGLKAPDCVIDLDSSSSWPTDPPIITDPIYGYIYPEVDRTLTVTDGDSINLSCVGEFFEEQALSGDEFLSARCSGGDFAVTPTGGSEETYSFDKLGCADQPNEENSEPGISCGPGNQGFEIQYGFQTLGGFTALYAVCFDQAVARTFYSKHVVYRTIGGQDTGNDRPSFKTDGYYDFDVNTMYTQNQQSITIEQLTGSDQYVDTSSSIYLARGHLSPNSDFWFYSHQDSTYYFVNVAPQWQSFNAGNWLGVEESVRKYIRDNEVDLIVYTGTHGVLQLDDTNSNPVDIYLYPDGNQLPVPKYYWKVIMNGDDNTGVAIIGLNNPHLDSGSIDDAKICTEILGNDMMSQVTDPDDIEKGVTFACTVEDASAVIEEIPPFGDLGILG